MKKIAFLIFYVTSCASTFAQTTKKSLDHSVYNDWKVIRNVQVSNDGQATTFEVNAQLGDGKLQLRDFRTKSTRSFERGKNASISPNGELVAFSIKPPYDSTRQAKLDKKKKDNMPKDSLGIWLRASESLTKIARVKRFSMPADSGEWMVYQLEKPLPEKKDKAEADSSEGESEEGEAEEKDKKKDKKKKKKQKGTEVVMLHPESGESHSFEHVDSYLLADGGDWLSLMRVYGDSVDSVRISVFHPDKGEQIIYEDMGTAKSMAWDKQQQQLVFLATTDTSETKIFSLLHWGRGGEKAKTIVDAQTKGMPSTWVVSEYGDPYFSESGKRILFGTSWEPKPEPEDTLTEDEKYHVDVWNWQDKRIQPEQKKNLSQDKKKNYLAIYHVERDHFVQLATESMDFVSVSDKGDGTWASGRSREAYMLERSWAFPWQSDLFRVNTETGKTELVLKGQKFQASLSPSGDHMIWYDGTDQAWYVSPTGSMDKKCLTCKLKVAFYDEQNDSPHEPFPYGIAGWTEGESHVLVRDRYDIWKIDVSGKKKPVNLTNGREDKIRFSYINLDRDQPYLGDQLLLKGFHETDKKDGYYTQSLSDKKAPQNLLLSDHAYGYPRKAKNADKLVWSKQSFQEFPDLWASDMSFQNPEKISDANPQQKDYKWGTVELVKWTSLDGKKLEGLLYKPEDYDPAKKYPMLIYYYEKRSDGLNRYSMPAPSRSTVYPSYYVSNDYLFFIPNIEYETGQPGPDAYNSVVSGAKHLIETESGVDADRIGLQGQSWGGYQTAYIITQTNMFTAAMAGAPVSNMTSAYGGIRWGSGFSRMFQYERTQSRLGTTLWEDMDRYIKNSPLFFAPNVETPVLMMHNDADGAVPWYQGIEFFMALRRLRKPSWLLVYNDEAHNLTRWANREDLSIRMQQFFDHYLKDQPAPVWMTKGLPALKKGKESGYELDRSSSGDK